MNKIAIIIAKQIKRRRRESKLTTEEVALKVGLKRSTISNIENGKQNVYAHTLWQIAKALDCRSISELFPDDEWEKLEKKDFESASRWQKNEK